MPEALDSRRTALVSVSAGLAVRDPEGLEQALAAAAASAPHEEVEEVILQSYLFLGYPVALNGFAAWRRLAPALPDGVADDLDAWRRRGEDVCQAVYGGQYPRLRENVRGLHPDMERWMVGEGYGKVLGRPGLSLQDRELCIVALLAVLDVPTQLYSHLRGALNVGASATEVEGALAVAAARSPADVRARAQETWRAVRSRTSGQS